MNLDSKSPRKELRCSFAGFQQKSFPLGHSSGLNLQNKLPAVAAVSLQSLLPFRFRHRFPGFHHRLVRSGRGTWLALRFSLHLHQRIVCFLRTLSRLFLFALRLLLFRRFLDSGEFPQSLFPLLGRLASSIHLQCEHLFNHRIELRSFRHSNACQFFAHGPNSCSQRPPLVQIRLYF